MAVLERHADRFRVVALSGGRRVDVLREQVQRHRPELAVVADCATTLPQTIGPTRWRAGPVAVLEAASHPEADVVLNAIVGAAGLEASLAALRAGKRLALANKESLVVGGPLVLDALATGGELVPVDSEHSAILQCMLGAAASSVRRIILTASGGPFREQARAALVEVTPADALRHPTWNMGSKITIDSATLANKALEVIEAHFLFGLPYDRIEVVIHPQSIVHSLVEFEDGSVLAQLGWPSMELPILYALCHPERVKDTTMNFDPVGAGPLTFERLEMERFPAYALGISAGLRGGTAPALFNAANEEAVGAFLRGALRFLGIADVIAGVLERHEAEPVDSLETVLAADRAGRATARRLIDEC